MPSGPHVPTAYRPLPTAYCEIPWRIVLMADDLVTGSDGLGGPPGTRWRNRTDDTWYQLVSSLRKPCAVCLRRHGRISPRPWPLPFHPHCSQ